MVFGPGEYFLDIKRFRAKTISPKVDFPGTDKFLATHVNAHKF